jgi:hypothetical protein
MTVMQQRISTPNSLPPSEAQGPNPPVETVTLTSGTTVDRDPAETPAPLEFSELGDDGYYAFHWGINE